MSVRVKKTKQHKGRLYGEHQIKIRGMPAIALRKGDRYTLRRHLVDGLWEPEEWRWIVLHPTSGAQLTRGEEVDWSYEEAVELAAEYGSQGWIIAPSVNLEDQWPTLLNRLRQLGWNVRITLAHASIIEAWKHGVRHIWNGNHEDFKGGMAEVVLSVIQTINDPSLPQKALEERRSTKSHGRHLIA